MTGKWRSQHLLDRARALAAHADEQAANEEALRRAVLILWQTNLLRRTKLTVIDEVANGLSSMTIRSSASCRASMPRSKTSLRPSIRRGSEAEVPSFLRIGSWIGGDRDGNPFVTADVLRRPLRLQSARALSYYLDELHELGARAVARRRSRRCLAELRGAGRPFARSARRIAAGGALPTRHHRHVCAPRRDGARA